MDITLVESTVIVDMNLMESLRNGLEAEEFMSQKLRVMIPREMEGLKSQ